MLLVFDGDCIEFVYCLATILILTILILQILEQIIIKCVKRLWIAKIISKKKNKAGDSMFPDFKLLWWTIIQPQKDSEILPFAMAQMDTEDIMLSEISQTEEEKHDFTYIEI